MSNTVAESKSNRGALYRAWEIIPGLSSWLFILSPIILSFVEPVWLAYIIIAYDLLWLIKAFGLGHRLIRGYTRLHRNRKIDWRKRLDDLEDIELAIRQVEGRIKSSRLKPATRRELKRYRSFLLQAQEQGDELLSPDDVVHAVIVAAYNEGRDILEPTVKSLVEGNFDPKKIWLFFAFEERGGADIDELCHDLVKKYGSKFGYAEAIKHPDKLPGENKSGKAGNITYTGRHLARHVKAQSIAPERVVVTTLDSDNHPDPQYFAYLTFIYSVTPERVHRSYQPAPMYYNNIWDVPAPMRVIATGNSFWMVMEAMRPHRLRNFSAHAQSLQALIDTDFWNTQTVVEDGHQFWRTYFRYDGNHKVIPLHVPVQQDAVLARGYWRTYRAQFKQLRRWAYGVSDVPYVFVNNIRNRKLNWFDKWIQFGRLYEGHFSWATSPLVLAFAAWMPLLLNSDFSNTVLAHQLPIIASRIQTFAMLGLAVTILISLISLPPRPAHYRRPRTVMMLLQWVLLPVTAIVFSAFAALNAQTRLMFGRYLEEFEVTEKATRKR
jgi:hypothetical protein